MKTLLDRIENKLKRTIVIIMIASGVSSCGSETTVAGISGTGITQAGISGTGIVYGEITGFGSIFVNGIKYEVDNASFEVDGVTASNQDDLKVGMVVKMETTEFDDGTFEANTVFYDDSIEGPITSTVVTVNSSTKEFTVMGVDVQITDKTSFHNSSTALSFNFENITQGDIIEVSGFVSVTGMVTATLVEKKGEVSGGTVQNVEMRGEVADLGLISANQFTLNGITVFFDPTGVTTEFDDLPNGVDVDGLLVEVKGNFDINTNTIQATEIEGEDDDRIISSDPNVSISLQGPINNFIDVNKPFTVSGVNIQIVTSAVSPAILGLLTEGLNVEVEGTFDTNGVLQANQVEIRESEVEYRALVRSVDNTAQTVNIGYLNTGELVMFIDSTSVLVDDDNNPISFADIEVGRDVKIHARVVEGQHTVVRLELEELGSDSSYEITGEIEQIVPNVSITIDGLTFPLDSTLVIYDPVFSSAPNLNVGTLIELGDNDRDGDFEEVSSPD